MASEDGPAIAEIRERLARVENDVKWLKSGFKRLDARLWFVAAVISINLIVLALSIILR
jgi:hypothetical protein